eukprot:CAMPEP_0116874456 /NCGR_PEP_ID=MMETSP0463-20121206/5905_1 /TAXON_ID=181622 /ORGANISM="Strombidinopsis sp, Strain SopsisLIS2011" /LENGTH=49 /DNA_ID=CAMNT_0004518093 /DNA_START=1810 /DNA_END=1959 /DNA_ORIENTATION=+
MSENESFNASFDEDDSGSNNGVIQAAPPNNIGQGDQEGKMINALNLNTE